MRQKSPERRHQISPNRYSERQRATSTMPLHRGQSPNQLPSLETVRHTDRPSDGQQAGLRSDLKSRSPLRGRLPHQFSPSRTGGRASPPRSEQDNGRLLTGQPTSFRSEFISEPTVRGRSPYRQSDSFRGAPRSEPPLQERSPDQYSPSRTDYMTHIPWDKNTSQTRSIINSSAK